MDKTKALKLLRIIGAGVFVIGVWKGIIAVWAIGFVLFFGANMIHLRGKMNEANRNDQG